LTQIQSRLVDAVGEAAAKIGGAVSNRREGQRRARYGGGAEVRPKQPLCLQVFRRGSSREGPPNHRGPTRSACCGAADVKSRFESVGYLISPNITKMQWIFSGLLAI
jgi:hypothetical protein